MVLHTPILLSEAVGDSTIFYTQQEWRNLFSDLNRFSQNSNPGDGIIHGMQVTERGAGANFSVDISSGTAWISDDEITNGGLAWCWSDATYNLTCPSPPGSGTRTHRVVMQMRNKGENGAYSTYDFIPLLLQDTGSGTPAQPASAITLAYVAETAGDAAVLNAAITDYRQRVADPVVVKSVDQAKSSTTTLATDPDLKLTGLAQNATYEFDAFIRFNGPASGGGLSWGWDVSATVMRYSYGGQGDNSTHTGSGNINIPTIGTGNEQQATMKGVVVTGPSPSWVKFQWAQTTSSGTAVTVMQNSYMRVRRIA